jgi:hypothetical protein
MKTLNKGTAYHLSEKGHRGFLYPVEERLILIESTQVDYLPYKSGGNCNLQAYKVLNTLLAGKVIWIYKN